MTKNDKEFKTQLIVNDKVPEDRPFPSLESYKLHGVATIVNPIFEKIMGRSNIAIVNIQFQEHFKPVLDLCKKHKVIIHSEAHINKCESNDMIKWMNCIDLNKISKKSLEDLDEGIAEGKYLLPREKYLSFPKEMRLNAFDFLTETCYKNETIYLDRLKNLIMFIKENPILKNYINIMEQFKINSLEESNLFYKKALDSGHEGTVIRYDKPYKYGRSTSKEMLIFKRVPAPEFDAKIKEVRQAKELISKREDFIARFKKENEYSNEMESLSNEKIKILYEDRFGKLITKNNLGRSVTSKKDEDRVKIDKAKDFLVEMINEKTGETIEFGCSLKGFDDQMKENLWMNKEQYVGKWLKFECKGYKWIGCPLSAKFIGWRPDRDGMELNE